ncbi:MAG: hypothetical protein N2449_09655 [Bacteroidales bacterium]|nr:hypothetical protein [Bacteroidales bacterium]
MITIVNLNSKCALDININRAQIVKRLDFLARKAKLVPLYLIDTELMDEIYPPQKKRILDEEIARRILEEYMSDREFDRDKKFPWEELWRPIEIIEVMVAVGVYVHNPKKPDIFIQHGIDKNIVDQITYPCIFITPERVIKWAERIKISSEVLFQKVYYHELGHAYIHSPKRKYGLNYYRVIEESYCNAVAVSRFTSDEEVAQVVKAIQSQSAEYRGYPFFYLPHNSNINFNVFFYDKYEWRYFIHKYFDLLESYMSALKREKFYKIYHTLINQFPHYLFFANLKSDILTFPHIWTSDLDDEYFENIAKFILTSVVN